ncbi:MAG TPA: LUD domain-containing protein [Burkholderiales bacterium]|nr:LUD domain-containing protein [Burkholderiales bacterium]
MNNRDDILARVRRNQPPAVALPEVPLFDGVVHDFKTNLERMGGEFLQGEPAALIRAKFPHARVICSATPEVAGNRPLPDDPKALADVDLGVVRARFGVAETGSVWLSEAEFEVNALGFLPQHLVVLLDPKAIVANLHHAYRQPGFREARYAVLMTGPSATADIEGILVRGAQGIRSLTVIAC